MKRNFLSLLTIMLSAMLFLSGCNKTEQVKDESEEFCINNGGTFEIVTSDTAVFGECTLSDGTVCDAWEYVYGNCPSEGEYPSTYTKNSLSVEDLEHIEEILPPLSYDYEIWDMSNETLIESGHYDYPKDIENGYVFIPEHEKMINREVVSSSIEDGMIYTLTKVTMEDDKEIQILYINDPETLFCRAITVENENQVIYYKNFLYNHDVN